MKPNLLLLTLLLSNIAFPADVKKAAPNKEVYGGVSIKEDTTLKKLLSLPGVAIQYKNCQKTFSNARDLDKIPNCLWNGDGTIPELAPKLKDEVKKLYAQEEASAGKKEPIDPKASEIDVTAGALAKNTNLTHRSIDVGIDYKSDPAVKALSAFFGKKLNEVLNGSAQDIKDKKIVIVDHKKFIDLYTSELGKSIVNSFTAYCMETDPTCRETTKDKDGKDQLTNGDCYISEDAKERKLHIAENLKTLNNASFTEAEGNAWSHCISSVTNVCYENTSTKSSHVYSKQKACLVMDYVKASRKNLLIAGQQKKFYDGLQGGGDRSIASIASNMKEMDEKESSADKLTQINSADIDKDFKNNDNQSENISKTNIKLSDEAGGCIDSDDKMTTQDKCKHFLDVNTTKNSDAVTEFGLRQFAKSDILAEKLDDKTNVELYLKEEGYTDQNQINDLTSAKNIDEVKKKIKDRFNDEKDAIIKEMASRIAGKTTVADGSIEKGDTDSLKNIKADLANRNDDLKNLIHFNNIVASYLNISEGDGTSKKITRNTASLFAEVGAMDKNASKDINERIKQNKDLKENQTTAELQIDDINQNFLKYTTDQQAPTGKIP